MIAKEQPKSLFAPNLTLPFKIDTNLVLQHYGPKNISHHFITLGLKLNANIYVGCNARCIAILEAYKSFLNTYNEQSASQPILKDLAEKLKIAEEFLENFTCLHYGIRSAIRHITSSFEKYVAKINERKIEEKPNFQVVKWLHELIDEFIERRIFMAVELITNVGVELIDEGDVILTYSHSTSIQQILIESKKKKNFSVIVVDNEPFFEGRELITILSENDIHCTYTLLGGIPYNIKNVTKIFVGAACMYSNGALLSRSGTALISVLAKSYLKPFYVFCETYKFSPESLLNSLTKNKLENYSGSEKLSESESENANKINEFIHLRYDLTPAQNIDLVVTEVQKIPPTSVPVIMREFNKKFEETKNFPQN